MADACLNTLLEKSRLSVSALAVAVGCAMETIIFTAVLLPYEQRENELFKCYGVKKEAKLRDDCYDAYKRRYNRFDFPLYGYILIHLGLVMFVYVAYYLRVDGRFKKLTLNDTARRNEAGNQIHFTKRKLFRAYIIQVFFRILIFVGCPLIQWFLMFPEQFPEDFPCPSSEHNTSELHCENPHATTKTRCGIAFIGLDALFFLFSLIEFVRLIYKAVKNSSFREDETFWATYLHGRAEVGHNRDQIPLLTAATANESQQRETPDGNTSGIEPPEEMPNQPDHNAVEPPEVQRFVSSLKSQILDSTEYMVDHTHRGIKEAAMKTDETFIDLIIQTGRKVEDFCGKERKEVLASYPKWCQQSIPLDSNELFAPKGDTADPRTILAVGRPGIGKTTLATKILREWAKDALETANKAAEGSKLVFLLQFRTLNCIQGEITLKKILSLSPYSINLTDEVFNHIRAMPEKVLLIFDGLDEASENVRNAITRQDEFGNSDVEGMPVGVLFAKLASGKLLNGATVLTTTRSTAIPGVVERFYKGINQDKFRLLEILGFTPDRVEKYVNKITSEDLKKTVWNHISSNANLLSLCYIPVNCFLVCTSLMNFLRNSANKEATDQSTSRQLPATLTEIYKGALKGFILNHHSSYRDKEPERREFDPDSAFRPEVERVLYKLGILAKKGIEDQKLIFSKGDILESANLTKEEIWDLVDSGLLHHLPNSKSAVGFEDQYCFIHLTFQEFLAARVISEYSAQEMTDFVSCAIADSKMELVLRFVAGLLRCKENESVNCFFQRLMSESVNHLCEISALRGLFPAESWNRRTMIHCLFEFQSEEMAREFSRLLQKSNTSMTDYKLDDADLRVEIDLSHCLLDDADCTSLVFALQHTQNLRLNLSVNQIGPNGCAELAKLLESGGLITLNLTINHVTTKGAQHLCTALKSDRCQLTELNIGNNKLKNKGAAYLGNALKHRNCKVSSLNVGRNEITEEGAEHFSTALKSEQCNLKELDLSYNLLTDKGEEYLANALKNAKLEVLRVADAGITTEGAKHFSTALRSEQCNLKELDLSYNLLTEKGAEYLANALKNAKLEVLIVTSTGITTEGAKHFSTALRSEQCLLKKLNLSFNLLTDKGAEYLASALRNAKLEVLSVAGAGITAEGAKYFGTALMSGQCQLKDLNLDSNPLTEKGAEYLVIALKNSNLEVLRVTGTGITEEGERHLTALLESEHCQLKRCYMENNY